MALSDLALPPATRTDSTPSVPNHAADHNKTATALAAIRDAVVALDASVGPAAFAESVQDVVASMFAQGANVTLTYDDALNRLTVSASGGSDAEAIRDTIGAAIIGVAPVVVTVNDAADTIALSLAGAGVTSTPYAATITPNVDTTGILNVGTLTGNVTVANPTGTPVDGQALTLRLTQDATGGRTYTFGTAYLFGTDLPASALPVVANAACELLLRYHGGSGKWRAVGLARGF